MVANLAGNKFVAIEKLNKSSRGHQTYVLNFKRQKVQKFWADFIYVG